MDLSSSTSISSSSVKESSSVSSRKISSSSLSSTAVSSKISSGMTAAIGDLSSEMDDLLASATGSARSTMSNISDRVGGALRSADLDLEDMLSGTSISSAGRNSSSSTSMSSSSTKQSSKMSSISQSSMEMMEGTGIDSTVKSSVKQSSSSVASTASLASETKIVDGKVVKADTVAEKASIASQSEKEKVVQDGQVLVDTGSKSETSSAALLKATKEMSQAELDAFFRENPAIAGKPTEALTQNKDKNTFEVTLSDLPEFSPKELTVKILNDVITVYGTHEEQLESGGYKMHQYIRKFTIPKGLDNHVEWKLNPDGQLAIIAGETVQGGKSQVHLDCTIFKPRSFFKSLQK